MYYAPSDTPSPRKGAVSEGTPIQLTPSPGPSSHHSPYYNSPSSAPTPNFIAFTTTEYVQPSLPGGGGAGGVAARRSGQGGDQVVREEARAVRDGHHPNQEEGAHADRRGALATAALHGETPLFLEI